MESILTSIKKLLGLDDDYTQFDMELVLDINSVLSILRQLGIGPVTGYSIQGKNEIWSDFFGERKDLEFVKTYVYLKVRLLFDPPQSGFLLDSIKSQIAEFECRIEMQSESEV